ncbi:MAG: hypothetical protein ILA34_00920 [Bacteroidaceae bacterium]|nr:hypothetical protein [Bacteroidaceae bacterium]
MKRLIFMVVCGLCAFSAQAQMEQSLPSLKADYLGCLNDWTPNDVEIKGSAQGFAVYKQYGFLFRDKGQCNIVDLKKKKLVKAFFLNDNTSHCNNANFGLEKYNAQSEFPLLYISECGMPGRCFVTDLKLDGTNKIVQRIIYDRSRQKYTYMDWCLDRENGYIYAMGGPRHPKNKTGFEKQLLKFRLPKLTDSDANGEVHLTDADILDSIDFSEIRITQGSKIQGRYAYLPEGYPPYDRKLNVLDLEKKKMVLTVNVNYLINEPEGVDIQGDWLYVAFHHQGQPRKSQFYRFKLK